MNNLIFYGIALVGGFIVPVQLLITQTLRRETDLTAMESTFVLYLGGAFVAFAGCLLNGRGNIFTEFQLPQAWLWTSGFIGVFYILAMFISAPHIGMAASLIFLFVGQLIISTGIDHYGAFGMPVIKISIWRASALIAMSAGAVLLLIEDHLRI